MKQLKRYLLSATCFLSTSVILLACPMTATSQSAVSSPVNTTSRKLSRGQTDYGYAPPVEEFSFLIKDFKINHQSEINNLNITVRYRYVNNISNAQYPDFTSIAKDIEEFLSHYPNEKDYWEILNKKLTLMVLEKYSSIVKVTSEMQVSPSSLDPYLRSSITTRNRPSVRSNGKKGIRSK